MLREVIRPKSESEKQKESIREYQEESGLEKLNISKSENKKFGLFKSLQRRYHVNPKDQSSKSDNCIRRRFYESGDQKSEKQKIQR